MATVQPLGPGPTAEEMLADTLIVADQVRRNFDRLLIMVETTLSADAAAGVRHVFLAGSGDLHNTAVVTELAFERLARIPTEAMTSLQFGLYASPTTPPGSVLISMSFSGQTDRAVESATLGRQAGVRVWAITHGENSPLARLGDLRFINPGASNGHAAAGYPMTMLTVYLIALRLGELLGTLAPERASELRRELQGAIASMEATLDACLPVARELGARYKDNRSFLFLGGGPHFGTALNSAARVMEAAGAHASAQDTEEWVHLQRWTRERDTPTFLIAPPGPSRSRAREVLDAMRVLGRPGIAIVDYRDAELGTRAAAHLPVHCDVREEFSPLVYYLPGELFAGCLSLSSGEPPFRASDPAYARLGEIRWGGCVQTVLPT